MFVNSVFDELYSRFELGKLSHAYLFVTNNSDKCIEDLQIFLKKINCPKVFVSNCEDDCSLCRLFDTNNLPSYVSIVPDGVFIKKEQILDMMSKFSTKPVYSRFNMYLIQQAEKLNSSSANTILKFLEEPTDNILGFFVTNSKESVLPTICSRCQIISCVYEEDNLLFDVSYKSIFELYLDAIFKGEGLLYNRKVICSLYSSRGEWQKFFENLLFYFKEFLVKRDSIVLSSFLESDIISFIFLVENILRHFNANGNIDLVLDRFVLEMEKLYE